MSESQDDPAPGEASEMVTVHLLDASTGRLLQVWSLASQPIIRIGRDPDHDIPLSDPYVSRHHAELRLQDGLWRLVSLGRHGVFVEGQRVTDSPALDGLSFRLGAEGPTLRFFKTPPTVSNSMTITSDSFATIALRVDEGQVSDEVNGIVDGNYFRQLQERAREIRRQRQE